MNRRILAMTLTLAFLALSTPALAQWVPPRSYWKPYNGVWATPILFESLSGNVNPADPAYVVNPGIDFDAEIVQAGYYRAFEFFGRAASATALLPMGRVSASGGIFNETSSGFGDLTFEFNMHLNNSKPIYNNPDLMRYEPGLSFNVIADLVAPTGEYDGDQIANLGQNRWIGRIGFPVVRQFGDWVPGRRTTLEVIPSVWLFSDNHDYVLGDLETDPMFQLEAHLTRDLDENLWVSLDANWLTEGASKIGGVSGSDVDALTLGITVGIPLTDRLNLTAGYSSTINDSGSRDIRADGFLLSLNYASADLWRGFDRLKDHADVRPRPRRELRLASRSESRAPTNRDRRLGDGDLEQQLAELNDKYERVAAELEDLKRALRERPERVNYSGSSHERAAPSARP